MDKDIESGYDKKTKELLDRIENTETSGMAVTKQWYGLWSEGLRYFFSDHDNKIKNRHSDWDWIVMNYVWPCAIQETAKLSKNYHKIIGQPYTMDDLEATDVWQGACQWQWQENLDMRLRQIAGIFCGKVFGYRVDKLFWETKIEWDDKNKRWLGDVQHKLWNPAFFWANGDENINDGDCGTVRWVDLKWAQSRWPEYADELETIAVSLKEGTTGDNPQFKSWISSGGSLTQSEDGGDTKEPEYGQVLSLMRKDFTDNAEYMSPDTKFVRISDSYLKDYSESSQKEEIELDPEELEQMGVVTTNNLQQLIDSRTGELYNPDEWPKRTLREWMEPNYPRGRNCLTAGEGKNRILLNPNEEDQKWKRRKWPFVVTPHYLLPFMWQGVNAVTLYKSTQDMINVSITHMFNNFKHFGDPKVAVEVDAVAEDPNSPKGRDGKHKPFSLRSIAGAIWKFRPGKLNSYKIEPPVPINPAALALFQIFAQDFKDITGLQDIAYGKQSSGKMTATESANLAISSNDRIYLQSVAEDEWCKQLVRMMAELMQDKYDEGRWIRIVGSDKIEGIRQITTKEKEARYDMTIIPGTALPFDEEKRIAKYEKAYQLFMNPIANPMLPDMLKVLDIPNWKKLLMEFPAYQKYRMFVDLYNSVKAGKIAPEEAVQILYNAAVQEFQSEQQDGITSPANQGERKSA